MEGMHDKPWERLKDQIYLGSNEFVQKLKEDFGKTNSEIPRNQRTPHAHALSDTWVFQRNQKHI